MTIAKVELKRDGNYRGKNTKT